MSDQYQKNVGLVIVAAGRGQRAGAKDGPKQYRKLGTTSVIAQTLACFSQIVPASNIICVIHKDDEERFAEAVPNTPAHTAYVFGGATRQESVFEGLKALTARTPHITHVMIHDAARPYVKPELIWRILEEASAYPNAGILPTMPVTETLKTVSGGIVTGTASRKDMHRAQTPQTFPFQAILDVHQKAAAQNLTDFTDDAALFEWQGLSVLIVEGDADNIKITYASDFPRENVMNSLPDVRVGNGYDVHVFGEGDKVVLCGVDIPYTQKLAGHSDADVGLHALTDALLATCGLGDIGDHFPPTDEKWRGMESHVFLTHAANLVASHGGTIMNVDVTLVLEAPKIAPHRLKMREKLSELLGIALERCSVKATTNEKMGAIGRQEGILAIATASVVYGANT
ncbi:MAG: bifunctional 2-C-methyl-D-erythritol 4-phosphate cytidylyltransferase/2-C-methyl-D-erythritol 2,4-cyclodiphosphate synthase [Ahrensia sp.]|nr:bifunctional 2-C-methyl-D-erythritol 4-phosphate cytidylyltransferase/2-C-methyl-D-erythritol 2,4-cyclodiphosphate synthase [Ahrensia sp.]